MALLSFPSSPVNGELYPVIPTIGQNQYQWDSANSTWALLGAATAVVPGTYGDGTNVAQFTVDTQGRLTFAQNVPIASGAGGTVTQVDTGTGLSGGPITATGTISLSNTTVTPDSYTNADITVNAQGQITAASDGAPQAYHFVNLDDISGGFDGLNDTFNLTLDTLSYSPLPSSNITVFINKVVQLPSVDYTILADQIIFSMPPTGGDSFYATSVNTYIVI